MRKNHYKIIAVALLFIMTIIACNKDKQVTGVTLEPTTLTLAVGETATLTATVHPNDATNKAVRWTSSDGNIATVTDGEISAKKVGTATITVITEDGKYRATCTVTIIPEGVIINGVKWATRNLAAHGKFVENPKDHGALFQWGRAGDGHEQYINADYPSGTVSGSENFDIYGQIVSTHAAYGKFIRQSTFPIDWRDPQDDALWNVGNKDAPVKTANDPCPAGWRLPTQTELASLGIGEWTNTPAAGRYFGSGDNSLFLPAAGCRRGDSGLLIAVGTHGYYWSSIPVGTGAYSLNLHTLDYPDYTIYRRANGFSVRCVAEH
ncbi:MAG: Ig-like domain-containing protein [Bacteroidetes bacterium]|nr:Ig-like domain-containing protein [Bacteroidota bacterium]MCL2301681.1 Ig-like domain-containing protein [Lentimicrobiaceae bacterium]